LGERLGGELANIFIDSLKVAPAEAAPEEMDLLLIVKHHVMSLVHSHFVGCNLVGLGWDRLLALLSLLHDPFL